MTYLSRGGSQQWSPNPPLVLRRNSGGIGPTVVDEELEPGGLGAVEQQSSGKKFMPTLAAMRIAAERGQGNVIELGLDTPGIEIDARHTDGRTFLAFGIAYPNVIKILLDRGANSKLCGLDGSTPLHLAIKGQHKESGIYLLKSGADVEIEDYENRKPLDIALMEPSPSANSVALLKALLQHGCDIGKHSTSKWRTVLMGSNLDVVVITETYNQNPLREGMRFGSTSKSGTTPINAERLAKPSISIEVAVQAPDLPSFKSSDGAGAPMIRKLRYVITPS